MKDSLYLTEIKERRALSSHQEKKTDHIVLCAKELPYQVGDSIAIYPVHQEELVEQTLYYLDQDPLQKVIDKEGTPRTLREQLLSRSNITLGTRRLIQALQDRIGGFQHLLEDKELLKAYLAAHEVWKILKQGKGHGLTGQEFFELLTPLLPRFYSIASSPEVHPEEIHLTVVRVEYGERKGVCTRYLSEIEERKREIPVYIQPHKGFTLPEDHQTPIIMVGPGTGIAPFRAFMQEREAREAKGKNWLFFGEWSRQEQFYYGDYWVSLESQGKLKLDLAFSRDQEHKVYVQHKMLEQKKEFFRWLEEGAFLYVCGDADQMAKDVEATLHTIIEQEGGCSVEDARHYVKELRKQKRYLRDVY